MSLTYEPVKKNSLESGQNRHQGFDTIHIPGSPVGAFVSVALVVICWFALPLSHIFILGTGGFGLILGLLLYWRHRGLRE